MSVYQLETRAVSSVSIPARIGSEPHPELVVGSMTLSEERPEDGLGNDVAGILGIQGWHGYIISRGEIPRLGEYVVARCGDLDIRALARRTRTVWRLPEQPDVWYGSPPNFGTPEQCQRAELHSVGAPRMVEDNP